MESVESVAKEAQAAVQEVHAAVAAARCEHLTVSSRSVSRGRQIQCSRSAPARTRTCHFEKPSIEAYRLVGLEVPKEEKVLEMVRAMVQAVGLAASAQVAAAEVDATVSAGRTSAYTLSSLYPSSPQLELSSCLG